MLPKSISRYVQLKDDELEKIAGGITADYREQGYCPFCQGNP